MQNPRLKLNMQDTDGWPSVSLSLSVACNVVSQTPEGSFTMIIPQQHRNCSFSIIYPVEIQIGELNLGQHNDLKVSISGQEITRIK